MTTVVWLNRRSPFEDRQSERIARGLVRNPRVRGQQTQPCRVVAKTPGRDGIPPGVFGGNISERAENSADVTIRRLYSALSARAPAARRKPPGTVVVNWAHARSRWTSAGICRGLGRSPPHAWGEQRGHGQYCQKSRRSTHVAGWESPSTYSIRFTPSLGGFSQLTTQRQLTLVSLSSAG